MEEKLNKPIRPGVEVFVDNQGNKLTRDESYAREFWQKQPEGMKEAMQENIKSFISEGVFHSFVEPANGKSFDESNKDQNGKQQLDEKSKQSLSAYRLLAEEMGYEIGSYILKENAKTVEATITKTN
jgi:hypothetical protein